MFALTHGFLIDLLLRQTATDSTGLLRTQVQGLVLLSSIMIFESFALLGGENSKHASNGFADFPNFGKLGGGAARDLGDAQLIELNTKVFGLLLEVSLGFCSQLTRSDRFASHCW